MTSNFITTHFQKAKLFYIKLEKLIINTLLFVLVGLVFTEVVLRKFGNPTAWSTGVAELIFIWIIFIGANQALRKNAHVGLDIITGFLPKRLLNIIEGIMSVFVILFLIFMTYYGFDMTFSNTGRLIDGTTIGYQYTTLAIPVGCILMLFTEITKLLSKFRQ